MSGQQDVSQPESQQHQLNGFMERFQARADRYSPFCLGIDPSDKVLKGKGLGDYCNSLTDSIIKTGVALVKPQSAYFERFGASGIKVLEDLTKNLRAEGVMVLLDVKRGDIASTNEAYAEVYFSPNSPLSCDAITVHPYLGFADLAPFFSAAKTNNGYVFVVAASSNLAGANAPTQQTKPLVQLIKEIAHEPNAGAVIGATRTDLTKEVLSPLSKSLSLFPGIGAQGGSFETLVKFPARRNIIPTSSRSILEAENFAQTLEEHQAIARKNLR